MVAAQAFPDTWSNFFILVGTGSATLAGLVFVALTIKLRGVARDATHRFRAINMLTGFTSAFLLSALARADNDGPARVTPVDNSGISIHHSTR